MLTLKTTYVKKSKISLPLKKGPVVYVCRSLHRIEVMNLLVHVTSNALLMIALSLSARIDTDLLEEIP